MVYGMPTREGRTARFMIYGEPTREGATPGILGASPWKRFMVYGTPTREGRTARFIVYGEPACEGAPSRRCRATDGRGVLANRRRITV